ncbi:MAG: tonB-system energizer ExbB [Pseudomonas sp.]|uniref:tonB-system energizer ExbB n=1 Tax=Pseudomonas sp. TaxID=306 RepID=UPI003D12AE30
MNSTAHSVKPTTVAFRPQRLRVLTALLFGLLVMPFSAMAEQAAPTAPATPATEASTAAPGAESPTAAAPGAAVPAVDPRLVEELNAKIEALGPDATPEQLGQVRTEFFTENGIAPETAQELSNMIGSLNDLATAIDEEAAAEAAFHDLSPWGMYQSADIVVKSVMIGLILASILTWTIWVAKSIELVSARRRLRRELVDLKGARNLAQATEQARAKHSFSEILIEDAREELKLSANSREKEGIKERVSFRLERLVAACGRDMSKGTGVLATIGSTAPFIGLFGTVWGIMNSFIGIAKTQTTNLAVVAPGIAEALLATALGLVAAIPAVIIYNVFARSIAAYKAQVADASAQVLLMVSRDLDTLPANDRSQQPHMVKAG